MFVAIIKTVVEFRSNIKKHSLENIRSNDGCRRMNELRWNTCPLTPIQTDVNSREPSVGWGLMGELVRGYLASTPVIGLGWFTYSNNRLAYFLDTGPTTVAKLLRRHVLETQTICYGI